MDKGDRLFLLVIPILFIISAVMGHGFFFRAGVSLSCAAIVWLTVGREIGQTKWWVIAGLVVSVIGDWFMVHSNLMLGIGVFFIAHACFCVFCLLNGRIHRGLLFGLLTYYLAFFFVVLQIPQPALFAAVFAYLLMSCVSLSAAAGLRLPAMVRGTYVIGIALFVFSDTLIALRLFAEYRDLNFLVLPTYFASHMVITLALVLMSVVFECQSKVAK